MDGAWGENQCELTLLFPHLCYSDKVKFTKMDGLAMRIQGPGGGGW